MDTKSILTAYAQQLKQLRAETNKESKLADEAKRLQVAEENLEKLETKLNEKTTRSSSSRWELDACKTDSTANSAALSQVDAQNEQVMAHLTQIAMKCDAAKGEVEKFFTYTDKKKTIEFYQIYEAVLGMFRKCSVDTSEEDRSIAVEMTHYEKTASKVATALRGLGVEKEKLGQELLEADPYDFEHRVLKELLKEATDALRAASRQLVDARLTIRSGQMK